MAGTYGPPPAPQRPRGLSAGAITGIVLACVFGALIIVAVVVAATRGGRKRSPFLWPAREESRRIRCRNNLNQLAKGMATYLNEFGDNRFYPWPAGRRGCGSPKSPDFGGAEWLASLYWTCTIPDPGVFVCPSSEDTNEDGRTLGLYGCPQPGGLGPNDVSYAAFGDRSVGIYLCSKMGKGAGYLNSRIGIRDDFPPNEPMACDDTQEPINHGDTDNGGMSVLFFDSHVEYWTHTRVDLETGVGQGDLVMLRN